VSIEVDDNGHGITPDNLASIFRHGFTTKKAGRGFGLHASAISAKAMGGSLTVESEGPGQGARFCLSLPQQPPRAPSH
jgi:C4-dicarboxylate-specific signal transduction histidine kinase